MDTGCEATDFCCKEYGRARKGMNGVVCGVCQIDSARKLKEKLEAVGKSLVPILDGNLVDSVWGEERPAAPTAPLRVHKLEFAGKSVTDKLADLRSKMTGKRAKPSLKVLVLS